MDWFPLEHRAATHIFKAKLQRQNFLLTLHVRRAVGLNTGWCWYHMSDANSYDTNTILQKNSCNNHSCVCVWTVYKVVFKWHTWGILENFKIAQFLLGMNKISEWLTKVVEVTKSFSLQEKKLKKRNTNRCTFLKFPVAVNIHKPRHVSIFLNSLYSQYYQIQCNLQSYLWYNIKTNTLFCLSTGHNNITIW